MRILILGFGPLARDIANQIKKFPEYGLDKEVFIYHIFTRRNSLSYGKDLVVEIPDPHGDGYRTYNDGLQSLKNYATTISNYTPWLLDEAAAGSFDTIIDCTNRTPESYSLLSRVISSSSKTIRVVPANMIGQAQTIQSLRELLDGGEDWKPADIDSSTLSNARLLNKEAESIMLERHQINRINQISNSGNPTGATSLDHYSIFSAIPDFDRDLIKRFIINGDKSDHYHRTELYNAEHDCLIIEHDMLPNFFGWHHTEQLASKEFLEPKLEIESARYIKYLSDTSKYLTPIDSEYAIEYVHSGEMLVTTPDEKSMIPLVGSTETSSFSYRPKINPPSNRQFKGGLETIIFTYRKMTDAD